MRKYPVGMVLGGYYNWEGDGASPNGQGTVGVCWSSSAHTNVVLAYYLLLRGTDSAVLLDNGDKRLGRSLRCLGRLINYFAQ